MFKPLIHNYNYRILNPSLRPVASVQIPISDGLGDVHGLYLLAAGEVGDGAGYFRGACARSSVRCNEGGPSPRPPL